MQCIIAPNQHPVASRTCLIPSQRGDARDLNRQSGVCLPCAARAIGPQTRAARDGRCGFVGATAAIVARQTRARRRRRGPLGQHGAPRRERRGKCQHGAPRLPGSGNRRREMEFGISAERGITGGKDRSSPPSFFGERGGGGLGPTIPQNGRWVGGGEEGGGGR